MSQVGDLVQLDTLDTGHYLGYCSSTLPPRSPKLNSGVERAHRTHTEEFHEVTESPFDLSKLRAELLEWGRINYALIDQVYCLYHI